MRLPMNRVVTNRVASWRATRRCRVAAPRAGVTLLELILALGLSVVLFGAIAMALNLFLRSLDTRGREVEETQIARAVLRMIADDIRSAVQHEELDFSQTSGMASVASNAVSDALGNASGGTGGTGGSSSGGGSGTGGSGSAGGTGGGNTSGGGSGAGGAGGSGAGSGNSNNSSGGSSTGGSGSSGGSTSGGSTAGGSGSSGAGAGSTSKASESIESAEEVPPQPGIFGNQYELQVDISRLPRMDEMYVKQMTMDGQSAVDITSDMKTVAYYVRSMTAQAGTGFSAATEGSALGREMRRPGLVRRQLDRAVTMYASQSGGSDMQRREQLVAPEVVGVEFRYFDGTQWVSEWDSINCGCLPKAIEIIVAVQPGGEQLAGLDPSAPTATGRPSTPPLMFRQVVKLPAARSASPAAAASTGAETTDPNAASGGTGTGTGGSSGTGGTP